MTNVSKLNFTPNINIGETVSNPRIVDEFKCSPQGGMRRSKTTNTLVLVSKHVASKSKVYDDKIIKDVYHYTGQGMNGDQSLYFAQNKTVAESKTNGVRLHFFEVFEEGKYIYMGEVILAEAPYQDIQDDADGNARKVWVFPLRLIANDNPNSYVSEELITELYEDQQKIASSLDFKELEQRAIKSGSPASSRKTYTQTYARNPYISEYTKRRANGICELCKNPAPFSDKHDIPYLESHHILWLSKNGPDTINNTVALCPNCHKRMHVRNDKLDIEILESLRKTA